MLVDDGSRIGVALCVGDLVIDGVGAVIDETAYRQSFLREPRRSRDIQHEVGVR